MNNSNKNDNNIDEVNFRAKREFLKKLLKLKRRKRFDERLKANKNTAKRLKIFKVRREKLRKYIARFFEPQILVSIFATMVITWQSLNLQFQMEQQ